MTSPNPRVDLTGRVLMNKLRVERLLGEGGMGAVYEVEHLITRHRRALKVMHGTLAANADTIARFIREAGVAGTLRTPYVVETFDAGQLDDGSPYVLMELLSGRPLSAVFESPVPVPAGRLVGLVCQVLEGLAVAHRAGIVHRDIKPDNVFVAEDERGLERVRILDFGISKFTQGAPDLQGTLTSEGTMMGTPYYMSPEQALGVKTLDARSDIYSVGVMLYEGLARRRPYEAETLTALVLKIHHGEHVPIAQAVPGLPRSLAETVERALSVDPTRRFGSAEEMLAALVPHSDSQLVTSLQTLRNAAPAFAETLDTSAPRAPKSATAAAATQPPGVSRRAAYVVAAIVALAWMGVGAVLWIDGREDVETSTDVAPRREPIDPQAPPPQAPPPQAPQPQAPQPQAPPPQPPPLASPVPAGTAPPPSDSRAPSTPSPAERDRAPGEAETTTTPRRSERPSPRVSTDSAGMREPTARSPGPVEGRFEIERGW